VAVEVTVSLPFLNENEPEIPGTDRPLLKQHSFELAGLGLLWCHLVSRERSRIFAELRSSPYREQLRLKVSSVLLLPVLVDRLFTKQTVNPFPISPALTQVTSLTAEGLYGSGAKSYQASHRLVSSLERQVARPAK